jgi:polysaccharide pyruvyl transferase WcaK-like protein
MKNILFATTCQWNPGDEFILRGVLNLLRDSGLKFNPLIYNRNPVVNPRREPPAHLKLDEGDVWENSFDVNRPVPVDYVVFAGTPEWTDGPRANPLLKFVKDQGLRCSFLGVGLANEQKPTPLLTSVLTKHTDVFVSRDRAALELVEHLIQGEQATCPSILSSKTDRLRKQSGRIGCVVQCTVAKWQSISREHQTLLYEAYARLSKRHEIEYIAHYIEDILHAPKGTTAHYSGLSADYYDIYDICDVVISPRLHGCGIAASLGIPSICLAHDGRGIAAEGFGSLIVHTPKNIDALIAKQDWEERSRAVLEIKRKTGVFYQQAIRPMLDQLAR